MCEEQVQLYDETGAPAGTAPRSRMRAENLIHSATGVVVTNSHGDVLVHRRTDTKDVYPGRWDFTAGGVRDVGETAYDGAVRELEEEVGISGVDLTPLGVQFYGDEHTRYWAHLYVAEWDGPVRAQPEEVAVLEWWPRAVLAERLSDRSYDWMPDSVALLGDWVRTQ